ncbi:MAG: hypothetical protein R2932_21130 [Caldilineaceae bacterium]
MRRLSGGNQQKVVLGRWLVGGFRTLLCFDPTRGIDIQTKREIWLPLRELAADGAAIVLYTSELAEIPLVCDRVLVLHNGQIVDEQAATEATESSMLSAAHGLRRCISLGWCGFVLPDRGYTQFYDVSISEVPCAARSCRCSFHRHNQRSG